MPRVMTLRDSALLHYGWANVHARNQRLLVFGKPCKYDGGM